MSERCLQPESITLSDDGLFRTVTGDRLEEGCHTKSKANRGRADNQRHWFSAEGKVAERRDEQSHKSGRPVLSAPKSVFRDDSPKLGNSPKSEADKATS